MLDLLGTAKQIDWSRELTGPSATAWPQAPLRLACGIVYYRRLGLLNPT